MVVISAIQILDVNQGSIPGTDQNADKRSRMYSVLPTNVLLSMSIRAGMEWDETITREEACCPS